MRSAAARRTAPMAAALLLILLAHAAHAAPPLRLARKRVDDVRVAVVTVDLASPRVDVRPALARAFPRRAEALTTLAERADARAAITGGFFDTRSLRPIGDVVLERRLRHFGGRGAALCLRRDSRGATVATIRDAVPNRRVRWKGVDHVLGGGIRLLRDGRDALNLRRDRFDPALGGPHPRAALGITRNRQLLLVVTRTPVTLARWSRILRALGARDAVNLDGGSSAGLVYSGVVVQKAARRIPVALVVRLRPGRR